MTPNIIGGAKVPPFPSQTAAQGGTPRIPQDLTPFIAEGKITQAMLDDPNSVLRSAIAGQKILSTTQIAISTSVIPPVVAGGGVDNIAFLGPNAQAVQMTATFWIETVERTLTIPPWKPGTPPVRLAATDGLHGQITPRLVIDPGRELTAPRPITLRFTQIQYTQTVFLNFNGLSWPHVSVATLVSSAPIKIPPTGWA